MEIKAQLNYLRIAPRKVRLAANLLKGKQVREAESILLHLSKRASRPLLKLLKSAVANAQHNFDISENLLSVKSVSVNQGSVLKRFRPRAFGRAAPLRKETSRVSLMLKVREGGDDRGVEPKNKKRKDRPVIREANLEDVKNGADLKISSASDDKTGKKHKAKPVDFVRRMFRRKAI